MSVVLPQSLAMTDVFYGRENGEDFGEKFALERLGGPLRPIANVIRIGATGDGCGDVLVRD